MLIGPNHANLGKIPKQNQQNVSWFGGKIGTFGCQNGQKLPEANNDLPGIKPGKGQIHHFAS
jgi:hypothetical protein